MRRSFFLIALCFLAIILTGCESYKTHRQLRELMDSSIMLPTNALCVYEGEVSSMPDSLRGKTKFIVFVDSTECSRCRISRFARYIDLFRLSDETQAFFPVLLVSTPVLEQEEIIEHLLQIELPFPVYLDVEHSFAKKNPLMLTNDRFYAVTVDGDGRILLVGDPSGNEKHMAMWRQRIVDEPFYQ